MSAGSLRAQATEATRFVYTSETDVGTNPNQGPYAIYTKPADVLYYYIERLFTRQTGGTPASNYGQVHVVGRNGLYYPTVGDDLAQTRYDFSDTADWISNRPLDYDVLYSYISSEVGNVGTMYVSLLVKEVL